MCTATNETPHDRLINFPRKSNSNPLPSWLTEKGRVLLRKHVKQSKYDDDCEEVDLIDCNPTYARVRLQNGFEKTVSLRDLAPTPSDNQSRPSPPCSPVVLDYEPPPSDAIISDTTLSETPSTTPAPASADPPPVPQRCSTRSNKGCAPDRLAYDTLGGD